MRKYSSFCLKSVLGAALLSYCLAAGANEYQEATAQFKQGQHAKALDTVNAILATKPKDAQARFLKALILIELVRNSEAISTLVALTNDYPELPEPYNNLAVLYASQGQYEKAKVALEMAIRTHPSYATAHENLGDIYAKMASQAYDRALQLDRSNANTQTKLELIRELVGGKASKTVKTPVAAPATAIVAPVKPAATARTPAPKVDAADGKSAVLSTVDGWAAAWSEQDVAKYLAFYAPDFKTPGGEDRATWEKSREARISAPKYVHVKVSGAKVAAEDDERVTVTFRQIYQSDRLNSSNTKVLKMVKAGADWLIQEEISK